MTNSLQRAQKHHASLLINQCGGRQPFLKRSQSDLIKTSVSPRLREE